MEENGKVSELAETSGSPRKLDDVAKLEASSVLWAVEDGIADTEVGRSTTKKEVKGEETVNSEELGDTRVVSSNDCVGRTVRGGSVSEVIFVWLTREDDEKGSSTPSELLLSTVVVDTSKSDDRTIVEAGDGIGCALLSKPDTSENDDCGESGILAALELEFACPPTIEVGEGAKDKRGVGVGNTAGVNDG